MGTATRLLVLWLLAEGPLHGYRIRKILAAPAFAFWFRIEDASVYAMLRSLVKQGFARLEREEREGNRPNRQVYRITPAGRAELRARLEQAWCSSEGGGTAACAALATCDEFEADEITALLKERQAVLAARRDGLERLAPSAPSGLLARREAALLAAEIDWIGSELERF